MPNWTDKVKQIWNSTKDIDENIEDIVKTTIKRITLSNANNEIHDPWASDFPKPKSISHEEIIETRRPANLAIIKKFEHEGVEKEWRADHNNYGFRCENIEEKTNNDFVIISLGCSFTYGAGVNVEDRWTDVFCKKVQETTNLRVRNYNLALEGHSNDYCARMVYKTILNLKPDLYCFLFTYRNRLEWITQDEGKITQVIPGYDSTFIEIINDGVAMYNFNKNFILIKTLCELHNVPFIFGTVDPRIHMYMQHLPNYVGKFNRDIHGIDGEHPSAEKQIELGKRFFNKYTEL
tara:strand:- start:41 stop:916 length:876 start_codon:yes stop_codon:yes gene_type:complete